ncbi:pathogenesis-related thaumatin-like protein 3.5 [Malania oleifera]|uniref:pathogenesis-related thaumatin-like protein 3.5 n=1 Tax=Malania oleifera TaxID=397392 RepID=UPI0025ADAC9F|nr:pathogenesis-related thaumatin-like protein 3.5 [Malania oleifera]
MAPPLLRVRAAAILFVTVIITSAAKLSECARIFTIVNGCKEKVWPGILPANNSNGEGGGFSLKPGQSAVYTAPPGWSGRIWGRTGCNFDKSGNGTCETGGCGNSLNCTGPGKPPSSIAEFTLGGGGGSQLDYYDVSLVDGLNLPIVVMPRNGTGNCSAAGCDKDPRQNCPSELAAKSRDGKIAACRSACNVFNTDEYCCRGMYGNPLACKPSNYSKIFKEACPVAYSYAYDDPTSILTCSAPDYIVTFCASRNQTVCSYHDNHLVCNGSKALATVSQRWRVLLASLFIINFQIKFY